MKKENVNRSMWIGGLLAGALIATYLYRNQDQFGPQQKKLKSLIADLKKTAQELGNKVLVAGQEQLEAAKKIGSDHYDSAKKAGQDSFDATKDAGKKAYESVKQNY
jgi:hypothetical protein